MLINLFKENFNKFTKRFFKFYIKLYNFKNDSNYRLKYLIKKYKIDYIIDVGAAKGNFFKECYFLGYKKLFIAYEPLPFFFNKLKIISKKNKNLIINNIAISNKKGFLNFYQTNKLTCSSLLKPTIKNKKFDVNKIIHVEVNKLDNLISLKKKRNIFLKVDTQGNDINVLKGSMNLMKYIKIIKIEVSFSKIYKNEKNFLYINNFLSNLNYKIFDIVPVYIDKKINRLVHADIIYIKQ